MDGERGIRGHAAALRRAAALLTVVAGVAGCNGQASTAAPPAAAASPPLRGAYTFSLDVDPGGTCGWPMTRFLWPVAVEVAAYADGTTSGSVVFPPAPPSPSSRWSVHAGPAGTQLVPGRGSPGGAAAAYDLVVDGGRWEAGAPTRARDGRGEIASGSASGATLFLSLPGSATRWECRSHVTWRLLTRYVDAD